MNTHVILYKHQIHITHSLSQIPAISLHFIQNKIKIFAMAHNTLNILRLLLPSSPTLLLCFSHTRFLPAPSSPHHMGFGPTDTHSPLPAVSTWLILSPSSNIYPNPMFEIKHILNNLIL